MMAVYEVQSSRFALIARSGGVQLDIPFCLKTALTIALHSELTPGSHRTRIVSNPPHVQSLLITQSTSSRQKHATALKMGEHAAAGFRLLDKT